MRKTKPGISFEDLFRPYGIPPTPEHEAAQEAAKQAGWTPPWDRQDQLDQKKAAGNKSGTSRKGLTQIRLSLVGEAHRMLKAPYRRQPFSDRSIDLLHEQYLHFLDPEAQNLGPIVPLILGQFSEKDREKLRKIKRDTLINDLKMLGIRSKR